MTSRRFAFTSYLNDEPTFHEKCRYLCYQREICPTTGKAHWQGYVEFNDKSPIRFSTCVQRIGLPGAHLEHCKGSGTQNRAYCSKSDSAISHTFKEFGSMVAQGERTDLKVIAEMVKDRKSDAEIFEKHPELYMRNYRGIAAGRTAAAPRRKISDGMPRCLLLHGPAGSGKSRWAYDNFPEEDIYDKPDADKWFDGYYGQKVIIINEFKLSKEFTEAALLKLCDRYPYKVQTKGGYVEMSASVIVLTSNDSPKELFGERHWGRWSRRMEIVDFGDREAPKEDLLALMGL